MLKRTCQIITAKMFYRILVLSSQFHTLSVLTSTITLGWKCRLETNTPAYFNQKVLYDSNPFESVGWLQAVTSTRTEM
jgi:hypothetical protein